MSEQSEVVEKRIRRTVIRRRVLKSEELAPSVESQVEVAHALPADQVPTASVADAPPVGEDSASPVLAKTPPRAAENDKVDASPVAKPHTVAAVQTELPAKAGETKPNSQPTSAMGTDPKKPIILGMIDLSKIRPARAAPEEDDEKKLLFKKVVKKRARGEGSDLDIGIDGIGRIGSLGQLGRLSTPVSDRGESNDRVFRPSALSKKKRVIGKKALKKTSITMPSAAKRVVKMGETILVTEFAKAMGVKAHAVVQKLKQIGLEVGFDDAIDADAAGLVAPEFHYEVKKEVFDEHKVLGLANKTDENPHAVVRPPVIAVMGHVDHGKTSLLDAIRKANVVSGEAGGITQHIGAYTVDLPKGKITFLDTPGHEAFTAMRARGASVTDIAILVVSAEEGVMPQTVESIKHAKSANVPIIVAMTKIDKEGADLERVRRGLSEHGLISEDWGGDTMMIPVSAHSKEGIPQLLDMILLQADMLELKADPNGRAEGVIIEARLDRGRGPVASILVRSGTLKRGDLIVAGTSMGKVRAMIDDQGKAVDRALPSQAVEVLGLDRVPSPGDSIVVVKDDRDAKQVIAHREDQKREKAAAAVQKVTLETLMSQFEQGTVHELKVIVKADVQGSLEAVKEALLRLSTDKVKVVVIQDDAGAITESDVMLASASNAVIVGFGVRPETKAIALSEREKVEVKLYRIIYELIDDVKLAMEGMLSPTRKEVYQGRVEIRQTFSISKVGLIAGCYVVDGKINRNSKVRLLRDNVVVADVQVSTLKRFKDDVREATKGMECGVGLEGFSDVRVGDVIEAYTIEESKGIL